MMFELSDHIKIAACLAAFLFTWRAVLIAALFYATPFIFDASADGVQFSIAMIIIYCSASIFINFKSEIRQALWAIAVISWIALLDYTLFLYETLFYLSYPYFIHGLDCYIIYHLIGKGARQDAGKFIDVVKDFIFTCRCRILWLSSFYR